MQIGQHLHMFLLSQNLSGFFFCHCYKSNFYFSLNNRIPRQSGERKPILLVLQVCPPVQGLALSLAECQYICFSLTLN